MENRNLAEIVKRCELESAVMRERNLRAVLFGKLLDFYMFNSKISLRSNIRDEKPTRLNKANRKSEGSIKRDGPKNWLLEISEEGYFKQPKNLKQTLDRLSELGHHLKMDDINPYFRILMKEKVLRRKKMLEEGSNKSVWHYSNW